MDPKELTKLLESSLKIPKTHATVGISNLIAGNKEFKSLLIHKRLPDHGWSDLSIQSLLMLLATLDTNNKSLAVGGGDDGRSGESSSRWCGVGEREGRVYSSLVAQRHYGLSHGMGRSGDITEPQPKAAGSSALVQLALALVLDAMRRGSGLNGNKGGPAKNGILLPLCTGMSMSLLLSSLRSSAPASKKIVLWSRIDQKSCFKAVASAGLECVVVPTKLEGDQVVTDVEAMERLIMEYGDQVLAVITTTSCFAPRVPDKVDQVARLCQTHSIHHVINNAYGLQCVKTCKLLNRACVVGRVDAIVCSTDKNFLVPVGGAVIISPDKNVTENVGKIYAGRASSSPIVDLFITLLSMGLSGYTRLLRERQEMLKAFPERLQAIAEKYGERRLGCPDNTISFGITLDTLVSRSRSETETEADYLKAVAKDISSFGAMLFSRCVSGTRVVPRGESKTMGGQKFIGFGSSVENYGNAYMTAACAIGVSKVELDEFFVRLDKTLKEFKAKQKPIEIPKVSKKDDPKPPALTEESDIFLVDRKKVFY